MKPIYIAIIILTLYGDLLKRVLPGNIALVLLYLGAGALLFSLIHFGEKKASQARLQRNASPGIDFFIYVILLVYSLQLLLSAYAIYNVPVVNGITGVLYIAIPLLFCPVIIHFCPQFDLIALARLFNLCMIPINLVGLIQYTLDPTFLLDFDYYSTGGIVQRNLLTGGHFLRFPSIFVSADRYSALALIQVYFTLLVIFSTERKIRKEQLLLMCYLVSGIIALLISGARSRILIALLIGGGVALLSLNSILFVKQRSLMILPLIVSVGIGFLLLPVYDSYSSAIAEHIPIVGFLQDSFIKNDIGSRVTEYSEYSMIPGDITILGKGVGYFGGKPTELGLASIWIENGLVGGMLVAVSYVMIIAVCSATALGAFFKQQPQKFIAFGFPPLILVLGLMAGMTGILELSSGMLLSIALGAIFGLKWQHTESRQLTVHVRTYSRYRL